jgi:hypothetical protein
MSDLASTARVFRVVGGLNDLVTGTDIQLLSLPSNDLLALASAGAFFVGMDGQVGLKVSLNKTTYSFIRAWFPAATGEQAPPTLPASLVGGAFLCP